MPAAVVSLGREALALLAAGRWAGHRWFSTVTAELNVVLIAVAIMVLWEAGGFAINVRQLRAPKVRLPEPPTGAVSVERLPVPRPSEPEGGDALLNVGKLRDASSGD